MAKIRCKYIDCAFLDEGYCTAAMIELNADKGCMTYEPHADDFSSEDDWNDGNEIESWEDAEEVEIEEDDDDPWIEEEDEY